MYFLSTRNKVIQFSSIPPLTSFSTINNISISVNRTNFTLVFFETACHAYSAAEENWAGSSPYILRKKFRKLLNTSASDNVSH